MNWEDRYAPRSFSNKLVDPKHIEKISKPIMYAPQQGGTCDHWWLCLGPDKYELKQWLVENIYKTRFKNTTEYFPALAEAPYLFTSFFIDDISKNADKFINPVSNNSFIGGIILSQAIELGLNALPILCNEDWKITDDSIKNEYRELMFNEVQKDVEHIAYAKDGTVKKFNVNTILRPALNIAVGYGDNPHTKNITEEKYLDGVVRYQKIRRMQRMLSISL